MNANYNEDNRKGNDNGIAVNDDSENNEDDDNMDTDSDNVSDDNDDMKLMLYKKDTLKEVINVVVKKIMLGMIWG